MMLAAVFAVMFALDVFGVPRPSGRDASGEAALTETGLSARFDSSANTLAAASPSGLYAVTKDGVRLFDHSLTETRAAAFNLTDPEITIRGDVAGIWEYEGRAAFVFTPDGILRRIDCSDPIINMSVGANGSAAVITRAGAGYRLSATDKAGNELKRGVFDKGNKYPTGAALSPDGKWLAVAFLDIVGARMNASLAFTRLDSGASFEYADSVAASLGSNPDEIIADTRFSPDGGALYAATDKRLFRVDMDAPSAEKWSYSFGGEVSAFAFDGDYGAAAAVGGKVAYISLETGGELWNAEVSERKAVTFLSADGGVVAGADGMFAAFARDGAELWRWSAAGGNAALYFFGNTARAVVVDKEEARVLEAGNKKE
jgi:hypothetical protein